MKLYVGNFSFDMTERTLRELFEPFGTVSEVKLITDRETGQSRGFGFVTMGNVSEGNAAIQGLDGKDKGGRKLKVNEARPKDDRGGRPSRFNLGLRIARSVRAGRPAYSVSQGRRAHLARRRVASSETTCFRLFLCEVLGILRL